MGRHGYVEDGDLDQKDAAMWRGRVKSSIRGKRGQKMLADLAQALDAMPEKRLLPKVLQTREGDACALGCLARVQGLDLTEYTAEDIEDDPDWFHTLLSEKFDVAICLIQEVEYENDEGAWKESPEQRWARMRRWVERQITKPGA